MNEQDTKRFTVEVMIPLSEMFAKEVTKPLARMYFNALKEFTIDQVVAAVEKHIEQGRFFPKPVELRDIININKPKIEDKALLAWNHIERSISKLGPYRALTLTDGVTAKSLDSVGGWVRICSMDHKELEFKKRDFIKTYLATAPTSEDSLPILINGLHDLAKLENKD